MKNKYNIRYSPLFYEDLNKIILYIKNELNNIEAANNLLKEIENSILARINFQTAYEPYISLKARKSIYYRIYVKNYIIFYVVIDDVIEVRRILYSKRDFKKYL